jgi:diadenosine tetraphosphate (Ap4A) HIT family hydrolase
MRQFSESISQSRQCDFCDELRGIPSLFHQMFSKYGIGSRIIAATDHSWAIAGLGALTPGYILILPRRHVPAIGYLSKREIKDIEKLSKVIGGQIAAEYGAYYGSVINFEHGANAKEFKSGKSVDHAHLHALPGGDIDFRIYLRSDFEEHQIHSLLDLQQLSSEHIPYLYFKSPSGEGYAYLPHKDIVSQYIRRIWAKALGKASRYNWRFYPEEENVIRTLVDITGAKEQNA